MARSLGPALGLHDLEGKFGMILVRTILVVLMYVSSTTLGYYTHFVL